MTTFTVTGMSCGHCVRTVTQALQALDPAVQVDVDLAAGRVATQGGSSSALQQAAALQAAGYPAEPLAEQAGAQLAQSTPRARGGCGAGCGCR